MNAQRSSGDQSVSLKSPRELEMMRAASQVVAHTIVALRAAVRPGVPTRELDRVAEQSFKRHGARSGTLNYFGFPGQLCVSVNEEVVHGIPGKRRIEAGDIVKLDVVAVKDGYYGDAAGTIPVGARPPESGAANPGHRGGHAPRRRASAAGQPPVGHLARHRTPRPQARIEGRTRVRRARDRPRDARGAPGPELRRARPGPPA